MMLFQFLDLNWLYLLTKYKILMLVIFTSQLSPIYHRMTHVTQHSYHEIYSQKLSNILPSRANLGTLFESIMEFTYSKGAFTLAHVGLRVCTAGLTLQACTECSHMNKEVVFTLVHADVQAPMWIKICWVSCSNFPHPQAFFGLFMTFWGLES